MTEEVKPEQSPQQTPTTPEPIVNQANVTVNAPVQQTVPSTGRRSSFRDIRRQLTEEDLRQTGVQKLLIEDFERAEAECEFLRTYVDKYHDKDKEVARLSEKLRSNIAMEIASGVGLAGGGAIVSLAPYFWEAHTAKGLAAILVGLLFIIGATIAKIMQVKR